MTLTKKRRINWMEISPNFAKKINSLSRNDEMNDRLSSRVERSARHLQFADIHCC